MDKLKTTTKFENNSKKRNYIIPLKSILDGEFEPEDDDNIALVHLSIENLNTKIEKYKKLFIDNKIKPCNAFNIDLISCVQIIVKRTNMTNFVEISTTFDAMSKVYSCRVDEFLNNGHKLIKEILAEQKSTDKKEDGKKNEMKLKSKKVKLMLTTADKLRQKEDQRLPKIKHLMSIHNYSINESEKPSREFINKYYDKPYWPEYNYSEDIDVNENQQEIYEMEDIIDLIENDKICPFFHQYVSKRDSNSNIGSIKLDNKVTRFNSETSIFRNSASPVRLYEPMVTDEQNSIRIIPGCSSSSYQNKSVCNQDNLESLSQLLPALNTNYDYTFFDPTKIRRLKCSSTSSHWQNKFRQMTMNSKKKTVCINSDQIHSNLNASIELSNKSRSMNKIVDFNFNRSDYEKLKNQIGKNQCSHHLWKPYNYLSINTQHLNESTISVPIKRFESCEYITMVPNWYENVMGLSNNTNQNSVHLISNQDTPRGNISNDAFLMETEENIDPSIVYADHHSESEYNNNETEINNDDMEVDINEEFKVSTSIPGYIDMHELKMCMINIIKPDGNKKINLTFKDLLLELPKLLSNSLKENISVAVIFNALCHLCNEHSLHLKNNGNELIIFEDFE